MSKPSATSSQAGAICEPARSPIHGPAHEYLRLLRSYLTDDQKHFVRDQIEARALRGLPITDMDYADLMQVFLSYEQSREVATFLAELCVRRGWVSSPPP
jgi:hypothetical protein